MGLLGGLTLASYLALVAYFLADLVDAYVTIWRPRAIHAFGGTNVETTYPRRLVVIIMLLFTMFLPYGVMLALISISYGWFLRLALKGFEDDL